MIAFLSRWAITTAALALAAQLIDGIWFEGATRGSAEVEDKIVDLVIVALISCAITAFVKPVLTILSIPFILVTLGLFLIVINALLLRFTAWLADDCSTSGATTRTSPKRAATRARLRMPGE